jgi:hypothetical protein
MTSKYSPKLIEFSSSKHSVTELQVVEWIPWADKLHSVLYAIGLLIIHLFVGIIENVPEGTQLSTGNSGKGKTM